MMKRVTVAPILDYLIATALALSFVKTLSIYAVSKYLC